MHETVRYSAEELLEFESIINEKLAQSKADLVLIKDTLSRKNDSSDTNFQSGKTLEDGAETAEKENLTLQAGRIQKFISQLEFALIRIKSGTYGICVDTGKLIPKERLRLVPHTQHSVEAKKARL